MQTATKVGLGVGGAVVLGGAGYYFFYRIPNMTGYRKLDLGASEWGVSVCQVRNPTQYLTATAKSGSTPISKLCGTIYIALGEARTRTKAPFVYDGKGTATVGAGTTMYAEAKLTRSSTTANWTLPTGGIYLTNTQNTAGTITGGSVCGS